MDQVIRNLRVNFLHYANLHELGHVTGTEEKISGTKDWRKRVLGKLLYQYRSGDYIIVSELVRQTRLSTVYSGFIVHHQFLY